MKLPKGAIEIPPRKAKCGTWVEMLVDAKLIHRGVVWFRIKGGFGGRGDREDWIADLGVSVSVSDYNFVKEKYWGFEDSLSDTIFGAMDIQLKNAKESAEYKKKEKQDELKKLLRAIEQLDLAVSDITRNSHGKA